MRGFTVHLSFILLFSKFRHLHPLYSFTFASFVRYGNTSFFYEENYGLSIHVLKFVGLAWYLSTHASACFLFTPNKPVDHEELVQFFYFWFQMPDVTRDAPDDTRLLNSRTALALACSPTCSTMDGVFSMHQHQNSLGVRSTCSKHACVQGAKMAAAE